MLNSVTIMGRLMADPELRTTGSGVKFTRVTLAVDRDRTKDGRRESDFITVVAWRGEAEFLAKYFKKGKNVIICGRLETRKWADKNGVTHNDTEVSVANGGIYFGDSKPADTASATKAAAVAPTTAVPASEDDYGVLYDEDEAQLPF